MLLVDSSAFVLASTRPGFLDAFVKPREIAICPPIVQEVLQGVRLERQAWVRSSLSHGIMIESPVRLERFEEAARLYYALREQAITIRKSFDCLIAAIAIHHDITILHDDRDFDQIAKGSTLQVLRVTPRASSRS